MQPIPGPTHHAKMFSRPASHMSYGGIDWVASSWISDASAAMSYCSNALTYRSSSALSASSSGGRGSPGPASAAANVARARWRALFTDATLVSRSSATSLAFQRSTSHRMSDARCRAGRCWRAAMNASLMLSRATATSAGSPSGTTRPSGAGCTQVASERTFRWAGSGSTAGPRSIGRARRSLPFSMSRQTLVAIR